MEYFILWFLLYIRSKKFEGKGTTNQTLACFVCYLKIINFFLYNNISEEIKNGIKIFVDQAVLKLFIKTIF